VIRPACDDAGFELRAGGAVVESTETADPTWYGAANDSCGTRRGAVGSIRARRLGSSEAT